jgi:hypothetical protein
VPASAGQPTGGKSHGVARQGEQSGERMAFATRLAHVRDVREDLDERTGLVVS